MKKIVNRVISQIIAIAVSVQMIGQYGASLIPQINAVGDEVQSEVSVVEEETVETESSDEMVETEAEPESAVNEVSDDSEESETIAESEYEDWNVTSDTTLNEMKEVNNLTISGGTLNLNGQKVIVHGNLTLNKNGKLNCNKGEISCENFFMNNSSCLYMTNTNDLIIVNGNFTHNGGYFSDNNAVAGTIEIKGDFFSEGYAFNPTQEQKVILSGTQKQTINFENNNYGFNILEINNTSKEGVYSKKAVLANEINLMNDCEIDFAGCTEYGKTLDGDLSIDGDYCLGAGILNLGNHNMTINGNLIQGGGTIKLGTGTLTVNGDYRIQSRTEKENIAEDETESYNYGYSTGSLEMMNEKCALIVKGNFITQSIANHDGKLTAGRMEIGGNFEQIGSSANSLNFCASGNHTVTFVGKKNHNITFENTNSRFSKLDISNQVINPKNVYIYGELIGETREFTEGWLYIKNGAALPGTINGNLEISDYYTFKNDIHVKGNLTLYYYTFDVNGNKITVDREMYLNRGTLNFNNGRILCKSNFKTYSSYIYMNHENDEMAVLGTFNLNDGGNFSNGKIALSGDCIINTGRFCPSNENIVVFNGDSTQNISINNNNSYFNKASFEGKEVIFKTPCMINDYEILNNCKVTFYGNGQPGWKLSDNEIFEGDLYLVAGTLDLDKYNLTITGNLIQGGGTIKLGTGTLTVNGDYRIQSRTEKENVAEDETESYNYGYSTGSLEMMNEKCALIVKGNFIMQSAVNHRGKLTAGTMEIDGNFKQISSDANSENFISTENHIVKFSGENKQNIEFQTPSNSCFCNLEINNDKSINFQTNVYAYGKIYDKSGKVSGNGYLYISNLEQIDGHHFSGKVNISNTNSNQKLEYDLTVGSIEVNYLHVNGNVLTSDNITVNNGLYVEGGTVDCKNNLAFNRYSIFTMNAEKSYVLIGGNFYNYSYYCSSWELTEGILDIKGDFIQTENSQFVCKDNHVTVLTSKKLPGGRDYTQTIKFYEPGKSKFNILRITKPKSKYVVLNSSNKQVSFDLIYNKLEENYTDEIPPTKVNDLEVSDIGSTSAKLSWSPSSDNYGVMGYEIHRNGEKIQLTGKTTYTDNHLMPETKYEYTVYAIDESWNYSEISDSVSITTAKDTEIPSTPKNLKISSRTGSSITITWSASSDNVGVAGYKIFRGNDEIADITDKTVYKDIGLEADKQYSYQIKAYDAAGNFSNFCDSVSGCPVMPVIKRIIPADASIIGGKNKELQVIFADNGNSTGNKVKFEYKKSGSDKFTSITDELVNQEKYSSDSLCAKCTWNIYGLEKSYIVRATVYDSDGNASSKEVEYTLDSAPPLLPKDFIAATDNGIVSLSWSSSISKNCIGYNIYRSDSENGEYKYLFTVTGSSTEMYQDRSVKTGETYFYKIESISSYDINSEMSEYASVTVDEDKMPPTISCILPAESRINKITEITAEARDNISVEKIHFYYQEKDSKEWIDLGEKDVESGKASFNFDTTNLADGEYTVKAIAQDANKNKSDAAVKDFTVDNTGISKIIIDEENCTANSSFVSIRWQDAVESDFGWFAVEKKIGENDFKEVGTTSQITGMHVEGLQPNTAYTFRVVGYDDLGNIGEYSDEITLTTTSDTIKPGISAFRPSSSSFSDKINISITGVDNIGIDSLKLRYSYDSSEEKTWTDLKELTSEKKNASETFTYIFDVSEMPEGEVYVEAEVTDTSGNSGEVCINKFEIDRTAPNAITDLNADGGSGSVHLTWTVSDNDIKSFEIYRCDGDKSEFSKIADCSTKDYYDTNVTFSAFYTYKIVAVDTAGNKSKESNCAITQAEEDTAAPKVHGFSYSSGTVLPSNPKFEVVASDNFKLDHVEISYKKADDPNNIWHDIKSLKMDSSYQSKEFDWKTEGFEEDKYILKAVAYDVSGLSSDPFTAEFTFDFTAPKKPVIELIQGNWKLNLKWSKNTEKDFDFYRVYRKADSEEKYSCIGDTRENEYVDNDVTPDKTYVYKIAAYDKTGNSSEGLSANIRPGDVDEIKPQISVDKQLYGIAGYEITFDGSDCTDNVRITNFTWELGNGDTIYGIRNTYIYKEAGTYEAKLTVEDAAGNSSSTKISVVIHEKSKYGNVQVEVVDSSGKPLKSAYVYLYSGDDSNNKSFRTDSNGIVNAALPLGNQKIAAYKDGYLPESSDVFVSSTMDNEKLRITLQSGELVTGILEVHRMSLAEMIEAGIDFNNPANYHSYTFTIELTFAQEPIPTYIEYHYVGGGGGYGGGFGGGGYGGGGFIGSGSSGSVKLSDGSNVQIKPIIYETDNEEDIPILAYVRTTENISFMKDIYAVDLGVINNANSPEFVIKNCMAKLNLPDGLSLAATTKKQTLTQSMDDIAGGQKKTVSWAIKGDKKGQYSLDADFSGTLMPFSAPVKANFTTETPFTVGAGDGINIYVYPESAAYIGKDYYIQFAVKNEGSDTFYNLKTSFGAYTNPGYDQDITVIYPDGSSEKFVDKGACYQIPEANECKSIPVITNGQSIRVGIFEPGDVVYGTYKTAFSAPGDPEEVYYKLIDSVVKEWTDTTNVKVHISPIPSHVTKYNVKHEIVVDTWADPVDMTTGGFIDSITPIAVMGESELPFTLNYNSINSGFKGDLGYGWSHDYETYLDISGNYINVHWNPTNYATFISENSVIRKVDGTIVNGEIAVEESDDTGYKNYIPISTGTDEFKLYRDDDGTYTLTAPGGAKNVFDETGKLIKTISPNGKTVTLEHSENSVTITETITGTKLILNYNNSGLLTSVSDENGRKAVIAYENELISKITNVMGESICYSYDENNRLISAAVESEERPYVVNKYDENGRVIEQDDGDENTPLTYFYYEGEEGGKLTVTATDRNNIHDAATNKNSHQVTFVSDSLGHVTSYTDQNGNTTRYSYDKNGNLITETDAHGNKTSYTYDENNWVTSAKDPSGYVTKMTYDKNGNITSVLGPNGEKNTYTYNLDNLLETISENSGAKKSYVYNDNAQVVSETIEGLGTKFYKYTNGRLTSVTDFMGNEILTEYDANGNISSVTDRDGNKTSYKYDALNRIISETTSDGTISYTYDGRGNKTSETDRRGNTVNYSYNGNNLMTQLETANGITKFTYDNEGRLTSQIAPDDTISSNVYDAAGHVIKSVNEEGEISEYTYDAVGNVKTITVVNGDEKYTQTNEYYPNGKLKKTAFADGSTQSYEYDKSWRITKITDGLGNSTITEYDSSGNVIGVTDAEGNKTEYTYDIYGRILTAKDANDNITTFDEYDANGNCLQTTLPSGQVITFSYNNEGMPIQVTTNYNGEDVSIFYEYDAAGRVKKYIDEEGNEFITEYDEAGNITKLFDAYGNTVQSNSYDELNNLVSSTDALGIETQYNYDSVGNLIKTIESINTAREAESSYSYDKSGRLTSVVDAENGTSSYEYDQAGRIIAQIDPNGGRSEYSYDSMGRIIESVTALGSKNKYTYNAVGLLKDAENARGQKTSYTYYKNGWIKSFTDEIGTVSYTYDGNGNVLTVTDENGVITREYNEMNLVTKYTDFRGNTIDYSYDQLGNLVALTYPGGRIVRYSYYKNGNIKTVTDWDNNVTSYEYDGNSRLTKTTRPDGSVETRTYDANGKLVTIVDKNGENVINQTVYSYDESGNVTNVDTTNAMGVTGLNSAEMVYNENNQLVKYNGETVKYDADGNMIYGPLNGEIADFKYDCRNRLVSAGGTTYAYDAENNRISKTVDKIKTEYVIDSTGSLTRVLSASTDGKTTYFIYGIGLISQEDDSEVLYYHFNNIGSTVAVTSLDGKIQEKFEYGPYGELLSENKCGIIFLYNGEYGVSTDENGLYYMRARYYNPEIKRFINQDVVIGSIADSPSLNRYAYVEGNPISFADPFGLSPAINWGRAGHMLLDVLGFIPVVGFVFDAVNAVWYAAEGDWFNAAASFVSMLPGLGDAIGALAKGGKACKIVTAFHKAGAAGNILLGTYTYGNIASKYLFGDGDFSADEITKDLFTVVMTGASMWGSAKDFGTSYCFVAGTLVTTEDGQKPIEEIEVGDKVLSENELTGEVAIKEVYATSVSETDELYHIHVNGEEIVATGTHPFYVYKFGWTTARALRAGDVLVLLNGELVTVEWIDHEILESPVKVYNFEVEDFHTYFVGESGILVHNGKKCTSTLTVDEKDIATDVNWSKHGYKHFPSKNADVKDIIKSTKSGPAKYMPDVDVETIERYAWKKGTEVTNGKTWKVMEFDDIIGASEGKATRYMRVEMTSNTIHGHPISENEFKKLTS